MNIYTSFPEGLEDHNVPTLPTVNYYLEFKIKFKKIYKR